MILIFFTGAMMGGVIGYAVASLMAISKEAEKESQEEEE